MLGAFSALIIIMLRPQTEVAAVDQDCHQSISCTYGLCDHSRIRTCTIVLHYSLLCVLSSIDDSQLTKGNPDVDDHASSPPAKKPRTSSHPDTSGGVCMCVHCIVTVVIPFSISEAMIWFHNRLLMCLWTCKGTGFYFIE